MTQKEAMKILRDVHDKALFSVRNALETLIPELTESEDERIRKRLITLIRVLDSSFFTGNNPSKEQCLAYLEKQKEQKSAEWKPQSESLEALKYAIEGKWKMIKPTSYLSRRLEDLYEELVNNFNVDETLIADKDIEELEAMKAETDASMEESVEWSEEDEEKMNSISEIIEHCVIIPYSGGKLTVSKEYKKELQCFLKSLRPSWKPSEEQIYSLGTVVNGMGESDFGVSKNLRDLYEQLKKL